MVDRIGLDPANGLGREPGHSSKNSQLRRRGRVLVVEPQNVGGMWHYAFSLSRALADADFQVILATLFPFEELGDTGEVQILSIGAEELHRSRRPIFLVRRLILHLQKLFRLTDIIARFRPHIVHFHNPIGMLDFIYFKFLKAAGVGVIYTAHDAEPLRRSANWLDWARYRAADAVLVHSSSDVPTLVSRRVDRSKITVIPHGNYLHFCADPVLSQVRAKFLLGIPCQARVVLFFGSVATYKGLDLLIEAFSRTGEDLNLWLIIAGPLFEDFGPYRRRIEELNLTDRILADLRYIPFAEFPKYFSAADLVAFPYRRISQSGVLQFAYAYGRPVVVANVGGLAEAVAEDRTGVVVAKLDPEEFSRAMRRVLTDQQEAARMGERGRRLARSKYSWEVIVERITEVYQSVESIQHAREG